MPAETSALCVAAAWVGLVSLVTGLLLVRRQTANGPPHPFTSAFVSGLLIGISFLVVLPEALDRLPAAGFTNAQVLLLFLGSAAVMFLLDHSVMEHKHVGRGERLPTTNQPQHSKDNEGNAALNSAVWKAMADDVPTWVRPSTVGREEASAAGDATGGPSEETDSDAEEPNTETLDCLPCEGSDIPDEQVMARDTPVSAPLPHAPVAWCPCHGGDPFANGGVISFNSMRQALGMVGGRQVCPHVNMAQTAVPSPPPSPPTAEALKEGRGSRTRTFTKMQLLNQDDDIQAPTAARDLSLRKRGAPGARSRVARCQRVCAVAIRVSAWMLHAMIDGMVLASAPSTYVLIATAVPVTACALQDVAAFTVTMARLGSGSRRSLTAAVVALSCAFPLGALVSHVVLEGASSDTAVNVVRAVVAGVFTYMALFELAPPHTHSRAANTVYLLCFTCGVAVAYLGNVVEQLTADESNASAVVEVLKQIASNGTLGV